MLVEIPPEYSFVVLLIVGILILNVFLGMHVMNARKIYQVPLPAMYDNAKPQFNCVQRGHQNFLETMPHIMINSALGGLKHPFVVSAMLVLFIVSRVLYMTGYSTGDPQKRYRNPLGGFHWLSQLVVLGTCVSFAMSLLGLI